MPTSASAHMAHATGGGRPGQGDVLLARKAANQRGAAAASTTLAAPGRRSVSSQRSDGSDAWGTLGPGAAGRGGPAAPPPWVPTEVPQHHGGASLPRARSNSGGSQAARPSWAPDVTPAQGQRHGHSVHAPSAAGDASHHRHEQPHAATPRHFTAGRHEPQSAPPPAAGPSPSARYQAPPSDAFDHHQHHHHHGGGGGDGDDRSSFHQPAPGRDGRRPDDVPYGYHDFDRAPLDRPHHDVTRSTPAPWESRRDAALASASAYGSARGHPVTGASAQHSSLVAPRDVRLSAPTTTSHASLTTSVVSRDASLSEQLRAKDRLIEELLQSRRELDGELHRLKSAHEAERSAIRAEAHAEFMHALRHGGIVAVERLAAESGADELGAAAPPKDLHDTDGGHSASAAAASFTPGRQLPGGLHFKPSTPLPHTRDNPRAREEAADRVRNALRLLNRPSTPPAGGGYRPQSYSRSPSMGH